MGDDAVAEALAGATYAELATALGVSASAVNKAVSRSRQRGKPA